MYIVIAGAGLVGCGLAERLVEGRHDVVVVDVNRDVCEDLASRTGALVLNGSATDIDTLEQAGIDRADAAIATMRVDADNLAFATLARSYDVPRIIARMRDPRYGSAYEKAGVEATIHIVDVFVNQLLLLIDEPHLREIATFGGGKASIAVDTVPENARVSGQTVSQIAADPHFPSECVISGICRADTQEFVIPRGQAEIFAGDRVFLAADRANMRKATKFLHRH